MILRSAAPARRQRGAGRQRYSKPLENNKTAPHSHSTVHLRQHLWLKNRHILLKDSRLTESKLTRAKMAKVERLSHTHLVLNEWTGTALQLRADQDPSREELHREGEGKDGLGEERSDNMWMSLNDIFLIYMMKKIHLEHYIYDRPIRIALSSPMQTFFAFYVTFTYWTIRSSVRRINIISYNHRFIHINQKNLDDCF